MTEDLADVPVETLADVGIEAQHPDDFLVSLLDLAAGAVCTAVQSINDERGAILRSRI